MLTTLLLCATSLLGQNADPITDRFEAGSISLAGHTYPYRLLVPEQSTTPQPLVVFLHGAGQRGNDNVQQMQHFGAAVLTAPHLKDKSCYVLAMQCPKGDQWASYNLSRTTPGPPRAPMTALITALKKTVAEHNIDTSRIYLTGLSMGGYGSWDLAARHPDWFAAVVPVCGGGHTSTAEALTDVPIWAFHGTDDRIVPERATTRMIEALRDAGGRPAYTPIDNVGHASWYFAYGPQGGMEWMFSQRNPTPPTFAKPTTDEPIATEVDAGT